MKFDLESVYKKEIKDEYIDGLIEEYTLCVDIREINGREVNLWCYDDDLSRLFSDSGIGVGKATNVKRVFKYNENYEPVGLKYGDYIETVELHQNGSTYLVPVYCAYNGSGADYAFAIFEAKKMKIYAITVEEIVGETVCVRATDLDDAIDKVESAYKDMEFFLEELLDRTFTTSPLADTDGTISEKDAKRFLRLNF